MNLAEFGGKVKTIFDNITALSSRDSDLKRDNANINGDMKNFSICLLPQTAMAKTH